MSAPVLVGRREFIRTGAALGGGLLVSLHTPLARGTSEASAAEEKDFALNAFVRIGTDESVTVISAHSEMGQGIYTSLPMLLNEELQGDWSKVRVEAAPVDKAYNHPVFGIQMTGGSTTSPAEWERYRKMGAVARILLVEAAAHQWNVEASSCRVDKGVVIHGETGRRATYGSLANAAAQLTPPADVHADWQADEAIGYSGQDEWHGTIWLGCQRAWNADGGGGAAPGVRRKGGEV
jgi:isoquinoline 1-oxidoreductase beta subunit